MLEALESLWPQLALTLLILLVSGVVTRLVTGALSAIGEKHGLNRTRVLLMSRLLRVIILIVVVATLLAVWGVKRESLWIFSTTLIGFIGFSIFAIWSLLSNVFAALLLLLTNPFKIDDWITLRDGDNSVTGKVVQMSLMFTVLQDHEGRLATIPNNMLFQKVVLKHTKVPEKPVLKGE